MLKFGMLKPSIQNASKSPTKFKLHCSRLLENTVEICFVNGASGSQISQLTNLLMDEMIPIIQTFLDETRFSESVNW
jgi:hypothetical protein